MMGGVWIRINRALVLAAVGVASTISLPANAADAGDNCCASVTAGPANPSGAALDLSIGVPNYLGRRTEEQPSELENFFDT